jgi:hypothetical protein
MGNFIVLPAEIGEPNPVHQPRETRATRGPHVYDETVVNNKKVGYKGVTYDRSEHEYPKMLFHPEYGMKPLPEQAKFCVGCVTAEQFQNALVSYQAALEKWQRSNRTKEAKDEKDQKRLLAKGWLPSPPKKKEAAAFDLSSDEL